MFNALNHETFVTFLQHHWLGFWFLWLALSGLATLSRGHK